MIIQSQLGRIASETPSPYTFPVRSFCLNSTLVQDMHSECNTMHVFQGGLKTITCMHTPRNMRISHVAIQTWWKAQFACWKILIPKERASCVFQHRSFASCVRNPDQEQMVAVCELNLFNHLHYKHHQYKKEIVADVWPTTLTNSFNS